MPETSYDQRQLVVFTKPARPGRVKTRLIGELSAEQTARLHQTFLEDLAHRLAGGKFLLQMAWALDEGEPVPSFFLDDGRQVEGFRQQGGSLGDRLFCGLRRAAEACPQVIAAGSDHPTLSSERIDEAFRALEGGAEVVLGPAEDGGYYLIGCRRETLRERLFEGIPWSTDGVLQATLDRCRELGFEAKLLAVGADVDTPEDLAKLERWLEARPLACPRTRRLLASWGPISEETRS